MVSAPQSRYVLLADDDADDRFLFQELVSELSISAFLMTVEDGEKLMGFLSTLPTSPPPQLIFLDINMPRKNGIECLAEIRSNSKFDNVPVFMFSTSVDSQDIDITYEHGANLYIPKSLFLRHRNKYRRIIFCSLGKLSDQNPKGKICFGEGYPH